MTNEEKAKELAFAENGTFLPRSVAIEKQCLKMAEWKDSQIKVENEKLFEKAWEVFQTYATFVHPRKGTKECVMTKNQFREALGL